MQFLWRLVIWCFQEQRCQSWQTPLKSLLWTYLHSRDAYQWITGFHESNNSFPNVSHQPAVWNDHYFILTWNVWQCVNDKIFRFLADLFFTLFTSPNLACGELSFLQNHLQPRHCFLSRCPATAHFPPQFCLLAIVTCQARQISKQAHVSFLMFFPQIHAVPTRWQNCNMLRLMSLCCDPDFFFLLF